MGLQQSTRNKIDKHLFWHEEFKQGNISAKRFTTQDYIQNGQLPDFLADQLKAANYDNALYVVYSYQTPIGWIKLTSDAEWFIPAVKYSNTTTHHQSVLMWAVNYKPE